jgi:anti-sigma factor RsiW
MSCEEAMGLISVQLDGELAVPEIARLELHLATCEPCRAARASDTWLHSLLAADAMSEEPPAALRQRICERLADATPAGAPARRRRWSRALFSAGVAGALIMLGALLLNHPAGRSAPRSAVLADALAGHRQYADVSVPQLDVTGDAGAVEYWIRDRLGLGVRLPSGAARGEPALGARLARVGGRPAAQVLYAADGRRISLFVSRKSGKHLPEEGEHIIDGAEVYVAAFGAGHLGWWQDGEHLYVAVSTSGEKDVLSLAALCIQSQRAPQRKAPFLDTSDVPAGASRAFRRDGGAM